MRPPYGVDVAPVGQACEAAAHGDAPVAAVVRTQDGSFWCAVHWWPLAVAIQGDGLAVAYSATAWARLCGG
ncbi:hypothetical protein [Thermomonospora umbrina]|uniref:Uncharacterized protein n=1 Tax=Thermomonospora umbrina TaxID=111806 RepID=A0A3D9SNE0_9ACTN|nr:hypothetical protein [Thermomonospora umbrina]REE97462.1 hypothetical protein DFJ69_2934 [Thermomonospora umbrina]